MKPPKIIQLSVKDALPVDGGKVLEEKLTVLYSDGAVFERFSSDPEGKLHPVRLERPAQPKRHRRTAR